GPGGILGGFLRKLSVVASALDKPMGDGIFLQRLGVDPSQGMDAAGHPAAVLKGTGGISFGPRIKLPIFEGDALSADGDIRFTLPASPGNTIPLYGFELSGTGKVIDIPMSDQVIAYVPPGQVVYNGTLDLSVAGFGFAGGVKKSFIDLRAGQFNLELGGQVQLSSLFSADAEGVVSNNGFAVCFGDDGERFGWGKKWGQPVKTFDDTCDVGPFRATPAAVARPAAAQSFEVRPGSRVDVVAARSTGNPPDVELTGPGGLRISSPAVSGAVGDVTFVRDPEAATTWILLRHPRPGHWTVTSTGAPIDTLQVADALPPVHVRVHVSGHGARHTLSWRFSPASGHELTLTEVGRGVTHLLLKTRRAAGHVTFRPADGAAGERQIIATVTHDGLVRFSGQVARYAAPAPARLVLVHSVHRHGRVLSWTGQPGASGYAFAFSAAGGATVTGTTRRARLTLPSGPPERF
ncbi:MAG: hypothetical protein ACTHMY_07310, partial [Solirubrobacteraceae bacterium]